MAKISRALSIAMLIYIPALLLDYLYTLFSLTESGFYTSILGIEFNHVMNEEMISTTFTLNNKIFYYYFILVILIYILIVLKDIAISKNNVS